MRTDTICTISAGTDFGTKYYPDCIAYRKNQTDSYQQKDRTDTCVEVILAEPQLTKREKEILILIRQGFLSKEIAYKLNLSIYTVNNHRKNILAKLNVDNVIEAINRAESFGILY